MNKAQIIGLVVPIIVGATAVTASKVGISLGDWTKDVEDLCLLAAAGLAWAYQHFFHKDTITK